MRHGTVEADVEFSGNDVPTFGASASMRALQQKVVDVADTNATILIQGESGVGKDVVSRAIHRMSPFAERAFVKVNCAALPFELLESELFGHEKGAFTGAYRRRPGKFELADGGTIFLDEIADMPLGLQSKLLHVLQDREFTRVGGSAVVRVDVRVIAATNHDLPSAVRRGLFREDLYYRLKVIALNIPPLRDRCDEIPALARLFVDRFNRQFGRSVVLGDAALDLLVEYSWPGNIRELENLMKRIVVLRDQDLIRQELLPHVVPQAPPLRVGGGLPDLLELKTLARRASIDAQTAAIRDVLDRVQWNRVEAAKLLKMSYKTLLYKMDQCGLPRKRVRRDLNGHGTPGTRFDAHREGLSA